MEEVDWKSVGLPTYVSSEAFFLLWQKLEWGKIAFTSATCGKPNVIFLLQSVIET